MRLLKNILAGGAAFAALATGTAFANCGAGQTPPPNSPCAGPASTVVNTQLQNADTTSWATLDVITAEKATGNAAASGNLTSTGADNATIRVTNSQTTNGSASATSTVTATTGAKQIGNGASATGNGMTVTTTNSNAYVDSLQVAGWGKTMTANAHTVAKNVDVSITNAQAAANNVASTFTGGAAKTDLLQYSAAGVTANAKAELCCVNQGAVGAIAAGNTTSTTGAHTTLRQSVRQDNAGAVRATGDLAVGRAGTATVAASASGNSITAGTTAATSTTFANQTNRGDVQANSWLSGGTWSILGSSSAYGVGNANESNNTAGDLDTTATQVNDGTIRAWSAVTGGGVGNDSAAIGTAVAIGNSNGATLCTACGNGRLFATNSQTNNGNIEAISRVNVSKVGSVSSNAVATGNVSSYYVGDPRR